MKDFEKVRKIGLALYQTELEEKIDILKYLLENFNDGRRKSFFCLAVNLLELQNVKSVLEQITTETELDKLTMKEKAAFVATVFQTMATNRNIVLKLNKKPGK